MNLKDYKFRKVTDGEIIFSTQTIDPPLLKEARQRGFYNGHTPYNDLFSKIFFKGANVNFKKGLDKEFQENATRYLRALIGSFEPKHEEKEAVCAMLLSELVDLP